MDAATPAPAEQEAAAIAALIGGRSPMRALELAAARFRVLPLKSLTAADLSTNEDTGLFPRTELAPLGECDAFVSHSWRDDGDRKHSKLHEREWGKGEPSIWLDKVHARLLSQRPLPSRIAPLSHCSPLAWLSLLAFAMTCALQACIDQRDIVGNLAALPVFLSGCKNLLILAGPTYTSR